MSESWKRRSSSSSSTSRTPTSTTRCKTPGARAPPPPPPFRLTPGRAPEGRRLNSLEWILTRDSHVKEVKLFGLGQLVLGRYRALFSKFYEEDRRLAVRRMAHGVLFGLVSLAAFYGMYALVASRAARAEISLGDLTLYLAVFRQGQGAVQSILSALGGLYEDALYMTTLFSYLSIPTGGERARRTPALAPPRGKPSRIELRNVSFRYPGRQDWALREVSLVLAPGEKVGLVGENGAGKSTLVKLLLRLYDPTEGAILYGDVDLRDMEVADMRTRIGAVFQDFVRYQFTAAENIGLGSPDHVNDRPRIEGAEVLVLDEPTAAIDAEGEHELFERFRALAADRTAIVISHRFSTIRTMADRIVVLKGGGVEELGSPRALLEKNGRYAHLFRMQAQGYLD